MCRKVYYCEGYAATFCPSSSARSGYDNCWHNGSLGNLRCYPKWITRKSCFGFNSSLLEGLAVSRPHSYSRLSCGASDPPVLAKRLSKHLSVETLTIVFAPRLLGSTRTVTNSSQTVIATAITEGFGQTVATTGFTTSPYKFAATSGYRNDGDAGLSHVGARYYDSQVGRFITRDTARDPHSHCLMWSNYPDTSFRRISRLSP
jgi:RHS repeat-associated protein